MASPLRRDARRYRRRIFAIGAVAFGVLYVVMAPMYVDGVERDLESRVPDELAAGGFDGITATFDGQDGTLSCDQPLPDPEGARQAAYDVWGVRSIELDRSCRVNIDPDDVTVSTTTDDRSDDDASEVDTASAATTTPDTDASAETATDGTTDAGTVPATTQPNGGPAFESLAAAVSGTPQLSLLDVLLQESGLGAELADPSSDPVTLFAPSDDAFESLPADVLGGLRADPDALRALVLHHCTHGAHAAEQLTAGDLEMTDGSLQTIATDPLTIGGIEVSATDIDAPNGVVHIIEGILVPDDVDSSETPVAASVNVESDAGSVTITGVASTEAVRDALVVAAGAPGFTVSDSMTVDPQAGLDTATAGELQVLLAVLHDHLINGRAGFDGESLYLGGTYLTDADRDAAVAVAADLGVEPTLMPPPIATVDDAVSLEDELNEYVLQNPIRFEQGRAEITDGTAEVLDQVALLAQQFDAVVINVQGHTDSDGNANDNLWLSRVRARAVRDALVERGLDGASVLWEGFGSEQPVMVGGVEDKAASRRVDFDVEVLS
jgi:OOP family OmpA-OmpF porin